MNITRRQHYVWRYYLDGWADRGSVAVVRTCGKSFRTNTANVGQQRDFYRIPVMSVDDEEFARKFIESPGANQTLVDLNMGWLDRFSQPSRLRRALESRGVNNKSINKAIQDVEIQSEESLHFAIEGRAVELLSELRAGGASFWSRDDDALNFCFFLSLQHLRTKAIRERVLARANDRIAESIKRIWPVIRFAMATNMGWSLFSERNRWHIRMLSASGQLRFITGDQPIINLCPTVIGHDDLSLYYPVSPKHAALFELHEVVSLVGPNDQLNDCIVDNLNRKIVEGIHEQAFGIDVAYLRQLMSER